MATRTDQPMCAIEQTEGRYAPAKELARAIIAAQREEIVTLRQLLTNG